MVQVHKYLDTVTVFQILHCDSRGIKENLILMELEWQPLLYMGAHFQRLRNNGRI